MASATDNPYREGSVQWIQWENQRQQMEMEDRDKALNENNPYRPGTTAYNRWAAEQQKAPAFNPGVSTAPTSPMEVVRSQPTTVTSGGGYLDLFKGQSYFDDPSFQNIVKQYENRARQFNANNAQPTYDQVSGYAETFRQQFKNYVGRDPNSEEFGVFFKDLNTAGPWAKEGGQFAGQQGERTKGLIKDYFTSTAQQEAERKAQDQTNQALAPNSAFDTWQNQYRNTVSETEKALTDYQARLFEKLRPQLLTSLHSQGLLNTGALNEAFAGAAKDLTEQNSNFIAAARGGAEQDIANKRYQIASSPGDFALQNTFNQVPNLMQAGQTGLQNVFNAYLQDQSFQNQMRMLEKQQSEKPSLLSQYGGMMLGGIAGGYGQGLGQKFAMRGAA